MPADFTLSQLALIREIHQSAKEIVRHRPKLEFVEWAEMHIRNPDGTPFRFRATQRQPARDMFNPKLTSMVMRAYSGAGKTYLFGAAFCYAIEQLRIASAVMFPNADVAEDWVEEELNKVIEATPIVEALRYETNLKRKKRWKIGSELTPLGANSSSRIRRLQASFLYADEIDAISQEKTDEGDKLDQFWKRGRLRKEQFKRATSYPSLKGKSKIDALYDQSDRCRWYVRCPKCDDRYELHTNQMLWTPGKPETARLVCKKCDARIDDETRREIADAGEYLDKNLEPPQDGGARGFHLGCMAHVGDFNTAYDGYLHEVASEIERGKKSDNPDKSRRVFVNTMDAESYEEEFEAKPDADTLYKRREKYNPAIELPAGVLMITAGVDVHKERQEIQIVGWGKNQESWGIGYRIIHGSPLSPKTWRDLDALLDTKWKHPSGKTLPVVCTMVDSGKWQDSILNYTRARARRRIHACKGAKSLERQLMDRKPSKVGRPPALQFHIGTHEAKDIIYQRLELEPPTKTTEFPRGYMHFPEIEEFGHGAGGEGTGFFEMLTAEDSEMKRSTQSGEFVRFFSNPRGARNEALDTFVYALGAERFMMPNYNEIAKNLRKK